MPATGSLLSRLVNSYLHSLPIYHKGFSEPRELKTGFSTFSDPKEILKKRSIGSAHLRTLHLIELDEGISVNELLFKLKITKQSLNRVLRDLKNLKMIKQIRDKVDTRRKLLYLDNNGKKIYTEVFETQKKRIFNALKNSDPGSVIKFKEVLRKIINGKK